MNNLFSYLLYVYFADATEKLVRVAIKLDEHGSQRVSVLLDNFAEDAALEYLTSLLPAHLSGGAVISVDELCDVVVMAKKEPLGAPVTEPPAVIADLDIGHLNDEQRLLARAIIHGARAKSGGGCRAFYTPEEWRARGEEFGLDSVLIVVHDGGDLAPAFNPAYECTELQHRVSTALGSMGYWYEPCTCWYTAIYKKGS